MKYVLSLLGAACLFVSVSVWAQAPETIAYQGLLTQNGIAIDGTVGLFFRLYTTADGTTPVWTESHPGVVVDNGTFEVVLGAITPFRRSDPEAMHPGLFFARPLFLGIQVNSDSEMMPRAQLAGVPSAMTLLAPARLESADEVDYRTTLSAVNEGRGEGISGTARQYGVVGRVTRDDGWGVGVWGFTGSSAPESQWGVMGTASYKLGIGVEGYEYSEEGGVGVRGTSEHGIGVDAWGSVVGVQAGGDGFGVYANGGDSGIWARGQNRGIFASSPITGIEATARDVAVLAIDSAETAGTLGVWSQTYSSGGYGVYSRAYSTTGITNGILGRSDSPDGRGVTGQTTAATGTTYAVRAFSASDAGYAVYARSTATSGINYGLWSQNQSPEGTAVAGIALATSGSPYAIYGRSDAPDGYAGYFDGHVHVNGTLSKAGGSFTIDHPLDPENRTLSHSFVESPDMMNVYNGNIRLDAGGAAIVQLPDWFEALNRDFRYQLTAIGGPAPNLHVAQTVRGNRFSIAGGSPGQEVSWQVTGIRRDAWAEANRIEVEHQKPAGQRGTYLHPEARGLPTSRGIQRGPTREEALRTDMSDLELEAREPQPLPTVPGASRQNLERRLETVRRLVQEADLHKR